MRRFFAILVSLAWGLWFGGLVLLFLAVQSLFVTFADRHDLAGAAASGIFRRCNVYQLVLAGVALATTPIGRAGRARTALLALFSCAAAGALVVAFVLTPRIEAMRGTDLVHSAQFRQLHGLSMLVYSLEVLLLLFAGILMSATGGRRR